MRCARARAPDTVAHSPTCLQMNGICATAINQQNTQSCLGEPKWGGGAGNLLQSTESVTVMKPGSFLFVHQKFSSKYKEKRPGVTEARRIPPFSSAGPCHLISHNCMGVFSTLVITCLILLTYLISIKCRAPLGGEEGGKNWGKIILNYK